MAALALRAESAAVFIVFPVARHAGRRDDDAFVHRRGVAVIASQPFVCTVHLEFRASVMIEVPNLPIPGVMAIFATAAQFSAMDVIAFMAGNALNRRFVFVKSPFVAAMAHDHSVFAEQWVLGVAIVLKAQSFPLLLLMAFLTCVTELGVMDIVLLVARIAVGRCLVLEQGALMTTHTFRSSVVAL